MIINSHLLPLNIDNDVGQESDSESSSIGLDIEIGDTEQIDQDFIQLNLNNDDDTSEDGYENSTTSDNNEEIICSTHTPNIPTAKTTTNSTHHKRRQWNVQEKLKIVSELNKGASSHALEFKYKCTRKMIREWKNNEDRLNSLVKDKGGKGKKGKRMDGAGTKLTYCDLDQHLIKWYRSKRGSGQESVDTPKEKVTFKAMIRQGQRFCAANQNQEPSKK
ncbi:unnamed protein product [Rotaria sp. Silwood2]|nr:unnamed protein product [Rotaria sp. Silwood2]CAF4248009.1 unnamed protein product [Rotaria sp. Silwood2]